MSEMTSRERVLTAMRRQQPDRVPCFMSFTGTAERKVQQHLSIQDLLSFTRSDIWRVSVKPTAQQHDYSRYYARTDIEWDAWGRGRVWDANRLYAEYYYPLAHAETVADIEHYPWPDELAPYRFEGLQAQVDDAHRRGYATVGVLGDTVFEMAWQLRSMDRLFEDILMEDDIATALLDKITDYRIAHAKALARAGVDMLNTGDDFAMQHGLLMSRSMLNEWFFSRLKKVYHAAREEKPDLLIFHHSCGKVNEMIPDLIGIGVDILNPVQPECVDIHWVKDTFGDRLAFSGGLGVQSVLPFGAPEEVREHVRVTIETLGKGGGLMIAPSHVIEDDVPMENLCAMIDAIDEFGVYG